MRAAPALDAMRARSPQAIVDALTSGSMTYQGLALSGDERRAVAEFISGRRLRGTVSGATAGACAPGDRRWSTRSPGPSWNGWGATIQNTHFQTAEQAGLTPTDVPRLR